MLLFSSVVFFFSRFTRLSTCVIDIRLDAAHSKLVKGFQLSSSARPCRRSLASPFLASTRATKKSNDKSPIESAVPLIERRRRIISRILHFERAVPDQTRPDRRNLCASPSATESALRNATLAL